MDIDMGLYEWIEKYKPIIKYGAEPYLFQSDSDKDMDFVRKQNPLTIWTDGDGDEGGNYIWNGYHLVNRNGYYVTEVPFDDNDFIQITLSTPEQDEEEDKSRELTDEEVSNIIAKNKKDNK